MRGIGGPRFQLGAARSEVATSGLIGLGWIGNAERHALERIARTDDSECHHVDECGSPRRVVVVHELFTFVIRMPVGPSLKRAGWFVVDST